MTLDLIKDSYDRKARLYPALLVIVPLALTIGLAASLKLPALESVGATLASCGGAFLLTQLARDAGKRREPVLMASWGGLPSVAILRHRDERIDAITKGRYHKKLTILVKGTKAPVAADERSEPEKADAVYSAWCAYLRSHTRDTKKFALLFQENVNYGYRRNVFGLRPVGITVSALSFLACCSWEYFAARTGKVIQREFVLAGIVALLFLLFWILVVSPAWVRIAADAYAARLVETLEQLEARPTARSQAIC
jgi:hypothetical protein